MFNYLIRQYIFRQSNGDTWNFLCDSRQNLCYNTLTRRGIWSNAVVLHRNAYQYFYADMDKDDIFHLLFQDTNGNIYYSRLDGQSIKTVPVLNSKTPSVYNKQLFIAPFNNSIYFFYVLQHDNSFMLACQVLSNGKLCNPKVIDYVSGSSLPCSLLYDKAQNVYAFYQSYDGKYLQLGYKKFAMAQKHWSDFTPVTKYAGNCEYPHAIIDDGGIIHLCYQRRGPKLFEMVYQQKTPDKNLWTPEVIIHSSIHSFENTSILQIGDKIIVYWVREDIIYYNTGSQGGNSWSKPSRLNSPTGRQLQCLGFKSNSPRDRTGIQIGEQGGDDSQLSHTGNGSQLPPAIYPGSLSSGLKLAFYPVDIIGDVSQLDSGSQERFSASGDDIKTLMLNTFRQIQGSVDEVRANWSAARDELMTLSKAYGELAKELGKYTIRLNMLENRLEQTKKLSKRLDVLNSEVMEIKETGEPEKKIIPKHTGTASESKKSITINKNKTAEIAGETSEPIVTQEEKPAHKDNQSLEPDSFKKWQEWKEPKEWQE